MPSARVPMGLCANAGNADRRSKGMRMQLSFERITTNKDSRK